MVSLEKMFENYINKIIYGDALLELKKLPENSVDSIVTDPPYGLEFMGKEWDKFKEGKNIAGGTTGLNTPYGRKRALPSFYQLKRFGRAGEEGKNDLKVKKNFKILPRFFNSDLSTYQQFTFQWATECLRVLKPGGYLLSFGGTRTYYRMTCAIEDAGFEVRDMICWTYGQGFPKSLNVFKQLQKNCECGNMEVYEKRIQLQWTMGDEETEYYLRFLQETDLSQTINLEKEKRERNK